jgi:hypothetical protein
VSALPNQPAPNVPTGLRLATERGARYGHPTDNFARIWQLWQPIIDAPNLRSEQRVGLMMIAVKLARLIQTPDDQDSADDIVGYVATLQMLAGLEPSV